MYSSVYDVRNALTPGADPADKSTAAGLDDGQLADAIVEADSTVNSYLPDDYTVALTTVQQGTPPVDAEVGTQPVRFWSRDIAAYLATLTFKRNKNVPDDDPVRLRFNLAMDALRAVRAGKINLPVDASASDDVLGLSIYNLYEGTLFGPDDFQLTTRSRSPRGW